MSEQRYYFGIPFEVRASKVEEPKFKVGDRVRVTKSGWDGDGSWHCADIGFVDTVVGFDNYQGRDRVEGEEWFYNPDEIELANEPPFAVGDRVKLKRNTSTHAVGDVGEVYCTDGEFTGVKMEPYGIYVHLLTDSLELAADCAERKEQQRKPEDALSAFTVIADHFGMAKRQQPAIVARVIDGQPRPSNIPYMHASVAAATTEAERLAKNNPGQEFAVYQRVCARVAEVQYNMKEVA